MKRRWDCRERQKGEDERREGKLNRPDSVTPEDIFHLLKRALDTMDTFRL